MSVKSGYSTNRWKAVRYE